jgi:SET domain-containing protein
MGLIIRSSPIHRQGCYTTTPIRKGTRIVEYTGERISNPEADRRYDGCEITYLFGLSSGKRVIDGNGIAALINHSCDPNCEAAEIRGRVWITAIRHIRAGEELTYDYNLYDGDGDVLCRCGSRNCRGSLYSEQEIAKRRPATRAAEIRGLERVGFPQSPQKLHPSKGRLGGTRVLAGQS